MFVSFLFSMVVHVAHAQEMQSISKLEAERLRVSLSVYYTENGFFPEKLEEILEVGQSGRAPLTPSRANRRLLTKLFYRPLSYDRGRGGFQDYTVWMKVLWIPQAY